MKKKVVCLLIFFVLLISFSCKSSYEINSYYDFNNELVIEINGDVYHMIDDDYIIYLKNPRRKIGKVEINNEHFSVFIDPSDVDLDCLYIIKTIFTDKTFPVFVRDGAKIPKLSEIKECCILYGNKKYDYDISYYYMADSNINELAASARIFGVFLELKDVSFIQYMIEIYYLDGHCYLKNYKDEYVELVNFPILFN